VTCPSGVPDDCNIVDENFSFVLVEEDLRTQEACIGTDCHWIAGMWSSCSSSCGAGEQVRSVLCPGLPRLECDSEEPESSRPCHSSTFCTWEAGDWSPCSNSCGTGAQKREVFCLSGVDEDCLGVRPEEQQTCSSIDGCEWQVDAWSSCSVPCGPGTQVRIVTCSGASEADCADKLRPNEWQSCNNADIGMCEWQVGEWSNCSYISSASCDGHYEREVVCPSPLGRAACSVTPTPNASRSCIPSEPCAWQVGDWSACSALCGEGLQDRMVRCPGGSDRCEDPAPEKEQPCVTGCGWEVAGWSNCSSVCGNGIQEREVSCPNNTDCTLPEPEPSQTCHATKDCVWQTSPWEPCSSLCGDGVHVREVICPSGSDSDCKQQRPHAVETCQDFSGCGWAVSAWSFCSNTCGFGTRERTVRCAAESDEGKCLAQVKRPNAVENCTEDAGCAWQSSDWSKCSNACGEGVKFREVWCPDGQGCMGAPPDTSQACEDFSGCGWVVGNWSKCSESCGTGDQTRTAQCPRREGCSGKGPATEQTCRGTSGCAWVVGAWSNCSSSCGMGVRKRPVTCPVDESEYCGQRPVDAEDCSDVSACTWQVGEWSACTATASADTSADQVTVTCGPRIRSVSCPTGTEEDCPGKPPSVAIACVDAICNRTADGPATFQLVLGMDELADVDAITGTVQEAVAASLNTDPSAVNVELVSGDGRRLSHHELRLKVSVVGVTNGIASFLESASGQASVVAGVTEELVAKGFDATVVLQKLQEIDTVEAVLEVTPVPSVDGVSTTGVAVAEEPEEPGATVTWPSAVLELAASPKEEDPGIGGSIAAAAAGVLAIAVIVGGVLFYQKSEGRKKLAFLTQEAKKKDVSQAWPETPSAKIEANPLKATPSAKGRSKKVHSEIAQSPITGVESPSSSLSNSLASEAGQAVAEAAGQLPLRRAAANSQAGTDGSTRPPTGSSAESPKPPSVAPPGREEARTPVQTLRSLDLSASLDFAEDAPNAGLEEVEPPGSVEAQPNVRVKAKGPRANLSVDVAAAEEVESASQSSPNQRAVAVARRSPVRVKARSPTHSTAVSAEGVKGLPPSPSAGTAVVRQAKPLAATNVRKVTSAATSSGATATVRVPSDGPAVAKVRSPRSGEASAVVAVSDRQSSANGTTAAVRVQSNGPATAKVRVPSSGPATAKVRDPSTGPVTAKVRAPSATRVVSANRIQGQEPSQVHALPPPAHAKVRAPSATRVVGASRVQEPPEIPALSPLARGARGGELPSLPPALPAAPRALPASSGSAIRVVSRSRPAPAPDPIALAAHQVASPPSSPSRTTRPNRPKVSPAIGAVDNGSARDARQVVRAVAVSREPSKTREGSSEVSARRAEPRPVVRSKPQG